MWMQGLRPRTPEAYFTCVEASEGARPIYAQHKLGPQPDAFVYAAVVEAL